MATHLEYMEIPKKEMESLDTKYFVNLVEEITTELLNTVDLDQNI